MSEMGEYIKTFSGLSDNVNCVDYIPYRETPHCTDYRYGEDRIIVLRNTATSDLELIRYKLIGAIPFSKGPGYFWFWGEIKTESGIRYLVFCFKENGKLDRIFCGRSPSDGFKTQNPNPIQYA